VLETDSPFMLKNEINTPANVRAIAETVAGLRGISLAALSVQTEINVAQLLAFQTA
jgi:TatD DNase family protein